jgi:hypothetical protein
MSATGVVSELLLGLGKVQARNGSQDGHSPSDATGDDAKGDSPGPQGKHSMDNGQVPVDCQQNDEKDFTVQPYIIKPREQLTHAIPKNPVVLQLVINPEGQREEEDQVRSSQVEEIDAGHASKPLVLHEDQDHQDITNQANDKHQRVQRWQQLCRKGPHIHLLAWGCVPIVIFGGYIVLCGG